MCYVTLRGLVYFGASIHVYHGVQMLVNMYYDLFATSSTRDGSVSRMDILFNCSFFALGILIFRGVEQKSKAFIQWPTVGFTLLLAARFIVQVVRQVQKEQEPLTGGFRQYSMSRDPIDVDPLFSAAVGIYIFILFVYNHSLEYNHRGVPTLPYSDGSSDTVLLLNTGGTTSTIGDSNNNNNFAVSSNLAPVNTVSNPLFELDMERLSHTPSPSDPVGKIEAV